MVFFYPQGFGDWLFNTLGMGLRFDALILSFILILSLMVPFLSRSLFALLWIFLGGLHFVNSLGWGERGEHLWWENFKNTQDLWSSGFLWHKTMSLLVAVVVIYGGVKTFKKLSEDFRKTKWPVRVFIFLILFVFARGSLGEDHLRRNHCDGRPHKSIRSFCMNPAYTFLKSRNSEFP
jgi:glucan phosphoethanolaminetransferase (alkaline phosphatase superfamily)